MGKKRSVPSISSIGTVVSSIGWVVWNLAFAALGLALVAGACWVVYDESREALSELALIQRAQTVSGSIVKTWEELEGESDSGQLMLSHWAEYTYRLPDGRVFTRVAEWRSARLGNRLLDLPLPYPVAVECLPEDPGRGRIKGDGPASLSEWILQYVVGGLIVTAVALAMFLGGIFFLRNGVRNFRQDLAADV